MAFTGVAQAPAVITTPERPVMVGIRLRSDVSFNKTWLSIINMDKSLAGGMIPSAGYGAVQAAQYIFRQFLQTKATHLLMLDDDCEVSEQTLNRLYSRKLPVVGALTWTGGYPPLPTIWRGFSGSDSSSHPSFWVRQDDVAKWFEDPRIAQELAQNKEKSAFTLACEDADLLSRTDAIGLHCVLIQREVLQAIGEPYLQGNEAGIGEDFDFSQRVSRAGADLYVDKSVVVGHIKSHSIRPLDYFVYEYYKEKELASNAKV